MLIVQNIWELQTSGALTACPGLYKDCLTVVSIILTLDHIRQLLTVHTGTNLGVLAATRTMYTYIFKVQSVLKNKTKLSQSL